MFLVGRWGAEKVWENGIKQSYFYSDISHKNPSTVGLWKSESRGKINMLKNVDFLTLFPQAGPLSRIWLSEKPSPGEAVRGHHSSQYPTGCLLSLLSWISLDISNLPGNRFLLLSLRPLQRKCRVFIVVGRVGRKSSDNAGSKACRWPRSECPNSLIGLVSHLSFSYFVIVCY